MMFVLGERSRRNMRGLHVDLVNVVQEALKVTTQDFGVTAKAVRTAQEQHLLWEQGRKSPGKIVTSKDGYKDKSNHQAAVDGLGYAVDLTPFINGEFDVDNEEAQYPIALAMAKASLQLGTPITWGGNWLMPLKGGTVEELKEFVETYKKIHPGKDFIDLPHFELRRVK